MAALSPLAGKPAPDSILVDVPRLITAYYGQRPDPSVAAQRVVFGTSGHRGSSLDGAFNEAHILAKDGLVPNLLAAEITARTGKDPGEHYRALTAQLGTPYYTRIDAPASAEQKAKLERLSPEDVTATELAGESITVKLSRAPGNNAPLGGVKVAAASGWFAARPSGTESIYKIYAESFRSQHHLETIIAEAQSIVGSALGASGHVSALRHGAAS